MIRSTVRSAGLAILLTMNGCGIVNSVTGSKTPGLTVAEAALEGGAGQIALQISDGILQESPNNTRAMEVKGDALSLLGEYDDAIAVFQALLAKDPDSVRANIGMGRLKLQKDPRAAEAMFQKVLNKDPQNQAALNNLGIARDLQGRHAEAQLTYRQVLAIDPNLDSAKVNMALSLAMSGQGPAAIELLRSEANRPGADMKVRHDFGVVLAMAGHRADAEAVLGENMGADQVRQVLDHIPGARSRGDESSRTSRVAVARQSDDIPPPDVVQVPEVTAQTSRDARTVRTAASPAQATAAILAPARVNAGPTPMVVRPPSDTDDDAPTSVLRPVNPVAAAMTYQRPLSLPLRGKDAAAETPSPANPDGDTTVVAMPPARQVQKTITLPIRNETAETSNEATPLAMPKARDQAVALPTTEERIAPRLPAPAHSVTPARTMMQAQPFSQVEPTSQAVPVTLVQPTSQAVPVTLVQPASQAVPMTLVQPVARARGSMPELTTAAQPMMPAPPIAAARPMTEARPIAPVASTRSIVTPSLTLPEPAPVRAVAAATASAPPGRATPSSPAPMVIASVQPDDLTGTTLIRDEPSVAVQFAATTSEQAAYAFWQDLVHRFPQALAAREPTVIRYERGDTVFWRVRTEGFGNVAQAQGLCARIKAGGQACFVPRS
jgi:Flp pilus assembly protein TadD